MKQTEVIAEKRMFSKPARLEIHYHCDDLTRSDLQKLRRMGAKYNRVQSAKSPTTRRCTPSGRGTKT